MQAVMLCVCVLSVCVLVLKPCVMLNEHLQTFFNLNINRKEHLVRRQSAIQIQVNAFPFRYEYASCRSTCKLHTSIFYLNAYMYQNVVEAFFHDAPSFDNSGEP